MANKKGPNNSPKDPAFTHDPEVSGLTEMPSITNLLRRKKLKISAGSIDIPNDFNQTQTSSRKIRPSLSDHSLSIEKTSDDKKVAPAVSPSIQPVQRKRVESRSLKEWNPKTLGKSTDPLAKGLLQLIHEEEVHSALFLAIRPPQTKDTFPEFTAKAGYAPSEKITLWSGMKWDPTIIPELWEQFIKGGVVEFPPPATHTVATSTRNIVRAAFGILEKEWLTLVRAGPAHACRGVLALISEQSARVSIEKAHSLFHAPSPKSKKAA